MQAVARGRGDELARVLGATGNPPSRFARCKRGDLSGIAQEAAAPAAIRRLTRPAVNAAAADTVHDDRDVFQASPDELPAIDIHRL